LSKIVHVHSLYYSPHTIYFISKEQVYPKPENIFLPKKLPPKY